jgi:hypothetical protein
MESFGDALSGLMIVVSIFVTRGATSGFVILALVLAQYLVNSWKGEDELGRS